MNYDALFGRPLMSLIVVGFAGIIVWYFLSSQRPTTRLVVQILFFAVMTLILVGSGIEPHRFGGYQSEDPRALLVILAKSLWWLHLAWAVIGFIRLYLVLEGSPREARLLQDLVVGIVYIGIALSILAYVFGVPIGTLVATSGVVAIILGLALQNTLADVFSGIALTLGRPYVIGDWILLSDGTEGRVVESNWRATHILTGANNVVVLPNSFLAKLGLTNVSRPDETHLLILTVRIAPTRMPASIRQIMIAALTSCNSIVREPAPVVALKGLDATALEVELLFRVTSPSQRVTARNEVLDLVYRHCKSAGLLLAVPPAAQVLTADLPTEENARPPSVTPLALIEAIPVFATLTSDEKQKLAETTTVRQFRKGDVIVREREMLPSLMMVRAGIIVARREGEERGRFAPGDFFGETGLLAGMQEICALEALTPATVYEIDQEAFAPLLTQRPGLAEEIAEALAGRAERFRDSAGLPAEQVRNAHAILNTIRTIFRA